MQDNELYNESNEATYCPEDDKLRLYVGRVPREEYIALKKEGWKSTPKQDCDFVAVWGIERENTAISYAGYIGDEDQSPTDRASDRAERFAGYREKRRAEAHGYADRFESQPIVHGYQNAQKADRAAERHTRIGNHAMSQWSKAEYWQYRTSGVIRNALYRSSPSVRMGRIKKIESDIRRVVDSYTPKENATTDMQEPRSCPVCGECYECDHPEAKIKVLHIWCGPGRGGWWKIAADLPRIKARSARYLEHLELRLSYEKQMLDASGGRAGDEDMQVGGFFCGKQIHKVNKSRQTGRVVSVHVLGPAVEGWAYKTKNIPGTKYALYQFGVERAKPDSYKAPTPEDIEAFKKLQAELKAVKPKKKIISIINPDDESAEILQKMINEEYNKGVYQKQFSEVARITQAIFSQASKGSYSQCEVESIDERGISCWKRGAGDPVCRVRLQTRGQGGAYRVIILTDKPQKKLPITNQVKTEVKA